MDKKTKIKTGKICILLMVWVALALLFAACARKEAAEEPAIPRDAAEYTMEQLKALNLKEFNACTDNYVQTYHSWFGLPLKREYRVFNELLQPGPAKGKHYESNHKFAEKIMERMTWEIMEVRQEDEKAEIDMEISNIDMGDVLGIYEVHVIESMLGGEEISIGQMIKGMADIVNAKEEIISIMDALDKDNICTMKVTLNAWQEKGQWKIHISDEFINAFMGNMMAENYSQDVEKQIEELTEQYERKMEVWGEEIESRVEEWG